MIGQNFFNYVDFMISKVLLYINQAKKLTESELTRVNSVNFYSVESTVWCCNYRERVNDIVIDNNFISTTKEKDQRWSEWKYGLPTNEVENLEYVPREQPDLQYLGKSFNYNPKNKVFFIPNIGQSITRMAKDFIAINNFNREGIFDFRSNIENSLFASSELQSYFVFRKNKFIPLLSYTVESKILNGKYYQEFELKNREFYTDDDILLSRNFKFPKLKWRANEEFLLYYNPFEDVTLKDDYKYINPSFLAGKVNTPRLFSKYDPDINGSYTEGLVRYSVPDFNDNKVLFKSIDTNINNINSCYIVSDDGSKIFEIVLSRIFFTFRYDKNVNTIRWQVKTKLNNKFISRNDKFITPDYSKTESLDNLEPSRFNLNPLKFKRIDKKYLNSLALMEHSPEITQLNYIEPFIYQPGTLPVGTKWQPESLDQTGGYPKGLTPESIETNNGKVEYKFNFEIKESGGDFEKLPNPKNESKYNFKNYNLVPTPKLIL